MASLDECMQARITRTHLFYLGIDDFDDRVPLNTFKGIEHEQSINVTFVL